MFRDVKPTSDITPFTMGGSAETVCVCMDYFCVYAFAYWIRREGGQRGHLYEGLEVSFWLRCMFMHTGMCVCPRVWAFPLHFYHIRPSAVSLGELVSLWLSDNEPRCNRGSHGVCHFDSGDRRGQGACLPASMPGLLWQHSNSQV